MVENLRSARRFISSLKMNINIESLRFEVYDKRTTFEELTELLNPVLQGEDAGIITEAGCPGIADPGSLAVQTAHQLQIQVVPLTGPSSIFLALMGSGLNGQSFTFHGYLPIDKNDRRKKIKALESKVVQSNTSQIFMETPYRNEALLDAILEVCQPATRLCIAANLTGKDEMIRTLSVGAWANQRPRIHKIPCIFILGN